MTTLPLFSSVPGQTVPGMADPAFIQSPASPPATSYQYYGHATLNYLDYLDTGTTHTLVAVPGGTYLMSPVNSRAGLTVPPPDGRWVQGSDKDFVVYRPRVRTLAEVRAAVEAARVARGDYERGPAAAREPVHAQGPARVMPPPEPAGIHRARADLERARVAHGHYAPGGCRQCMSGGAGG